jgi:hypothetical protein
MSNKEFTNVLEELTELHNLKNQDYATTENPYKNLEGVERLGIPAWRGVVIRMMDKFSRLEEFCVKEELAVKDETIEDTLKDIAIYSVLAMILYRKRIAGASNDPDIMDWRFLASIHKKRKALEQELIENERGKGSEELGVDDDTQLGFSLNARLNDMRKDAEEILKEDQYHKIMKKFEDEDYEFYGSEYKDQMEEAKASTERNKLNFKKKYK